MGILDELREQANQKQLEQQEDTLLQEQRLHNYKTLILPKMQQIFSYFKELIDYLKIIETPIEVPHYSEHYPDMGILYQQDYRLSTDKHGGIASIEKLTDINLRFTCQGLGSDSFEYTVEYQDEADVEREFLLQHNIPFKYNHNMGNNKAGEITFHISRKIPVLFTFSVDFENSCIILEIHNHDNFESRSLTIEIEQINEDYLDKLARYILRKDHEFLRMTIDEKAKEKIRQQIRRQKQALAHELEILSSSEKTEQKKQEIDKVKNKIRGFFEQIKK